MKDDLVWNVYEDGWNLKAVHLPYEVCVPSKL